MQIADVNKAYNGEASGEFFHTDNKVQREIIFRKRRYQEKPILQGLQKLWNVVRCAGIYIKCNTYATGMQQRL